ncbi:MAG: PHP domain-containing protein [Clostridia bacterium]|nr:PHP domain-containing protein [Clostridia bacterium]
MKLYYDFHTHSCLSPCGDKDMTPYNLVNMSKLLGLDIIALTDHNTCKNCESAIKVGNSIGLTVIPGMELCTSEEVHVVCLFSDCESAMSFSDYIHTTMPPVQNRPDIFGDQLVMDECDNVIGTEEILLTLASSVSISNVCELVESYGGVCYPAHIDRSSYSVLSNLGMITEDMGFRAVEMTADADREMLIKNHPILDGAKVFVDSDAHYLENLKDAQNIIDLSENSSRAVIDYIKALPKLHI